MRKLGDPMALLFDWPVRHAVHLGLPLALAVSALAHVGGLLAFTLAPIPPAALFQRSAEVNFLPDDHPRTRHLSLAAQANDPSLFSPSAVEIGSVWNLSETGYPLSFDGWEPRFRNTTKANLTALPAVLPTGPVRTNPIQSSGKDAGSKPKAETKVTLAGELEGRSFQWPENTAFLAPGHQSLSPSEFLVSVAPDGLVLHVFPIASSGIENLDQKAIRILLEGRFAMHEAATPAWGTVTFLWGDDVQPLENE